MKYEFKDYIKYLKQNRLRGLKKKIIQITKSEFEDICNERKNDGRPGIIEECCIRSPGSWLHFDGYVENVGEIICGKGCFYFDEMFYFKFI